MSASRDRFSVKRRYAPVLMVFFVYRIEFSKVAAENIIRWNIKFGTRKIITIMLSEGLRALGRKN